MLQAAIRMQKTTVQRKFGFQVVLCLAVGRLLANIAKHILLYTCLFQPLSGQAMFEVALQERDILQDVAAAAAAATANHAEVVDEAAGKKDVANWKKACRT